MSEPANGTLSWRVQELEKQLDVLRAKVEHLLWTAFSLALSITGAAIVIAISRWVE